MTTDENEPKTARATGSTIRCESCGYAGTIDTYLPSMSMHADCQCPDCGSMNNAHNADYSRALRKSWNCKHVGTLVDNGKRSGGGHPLLECTDCGSIGLDWAMRGESMPLSNN